MSTNQEAINEAKARSSQPCKECGIAPNCSTCGESKPECTYIVQCIDCDGERYYYQGVRWRKVAMEAKAALLSLERPWWRRLLRLKGPKLLPEAVKEAVDAALELEEERR